jgi:hypothetical protein
MRQQREILLEADSHYHSADIFKLGIKLVQQFFVGSKIDRSESLPPRLHRLGKPRRNAVIGTLGQQPVRDSKAGDYKEAGRHAPTLTRNPSV